MGQRGGQSAQPENKGFWHKSFQLSSKMQGKKKIKQKHVYLMPFPGAAFEYAEKRLPLSADFT